MSPTTLEVRDAYRAGSSEVHRSQDSSLTPIPPGVVHDLGNLIQIATSAVSVVASRLGDASDPSTVRAVAGATTSLEQAGALIRQTMSMARAAGKALDLVDVALFLNEFEVLIQPSWRPNIRLDLLIGSDLPAVLCDRIGLQNAVLNLIFNARDAMPDGGTISISAVAEDYALGAAVIIRVTDTGLGMSEQTMARAFDPCFSTKDGGLGGFGLSMVRSFALEVDGSVDIQSSLSTGTTVTLRLPCNGRQESPAAGPILAATD
ncbi:ATP-binding protein [Microvirga terrae]|uniref:histidine kinase n=1 Tax=Microvirga terrae TaxID=2740529 RepID=A0ABY5RQ03_9HYPH|nr:MULTISPECIES: ATP-binding protein [Microvirga]UVF18989.1 ATP-binding protein [Microvirga terrae]